MKKIILMMLVTGFLTTSVATYAQNAPKEKTESGDTKNKVKPNTTAGDKVHNVVHPKHKRAHGVKAKHKSDAGKVKAETGTPRQ